MYIKVPAIILIDGNILADGAASTGANHGGGSGGSIWIEAGWYCFKIDWINLVDVLLIFTWETTFVTVI